MKKSPLSRNADIAKIRRALPSGAITRISKTTGEPYRLVYRTLQGFIKHWDPRHDAVIKSAKRELRDAGIVLK